jgi:hypothetical protein
MNVGGRGINAYRTLVGNLGGEKPLGRPLWRWVNNIKVDLKIQDSRWGAGSG